MATETPTLDEAVKDSVKTNGVPEPPAAIEEPKEPEAAKPDEVRMIPLDKRTQEALDLATQLADPENGPKLIQFLHDQFVKKAEKTDQTIQAVQKDFTEIMKSRLPEDQKWLADTFGPAFKAAAAEMIEESVKPLREGFNKEIERRVEASIDSEIQHFMKEHKMKDEKDPVWQEMEKLQTEMPWSGKGDMQTYLSRIHTLASKDTIESNAVKKTVDKINRNAKDLASMSSEVSEARVSKGSKLPSLTESISAAMKGERFI